MHFALTPNSFFHLATSPTGGARVSPTRAPRSPAQQMWWTVDNVAEELGVHEKTVRRWIHNGSLTAKRVGKGFRIHRFAVAALLDREPVGPQLPPRRRGGQLSQLPPPGIRQMYQERELQPHQQNG